MNNLLKFIGVVIMAAGVLFGLWVALWWGWIGGIVEVIEAAKANPVDSYRLAVGIVRIIFANFIGACAGWLIVSFGTLVANAGIDRRPRRW